MLTEADIRALLAQRAETPNLDYKAGFAWTKENTDQKYELVRDLMGMANTEDGGRVIFGVRNHDFAYVGVSDDIHASMEANNVVEMLHTAGAPKTKCSVSKHEIDGKKVIVLDVAEFEDTPIICQRAYKRNDGTVVLREGALYVRTEAAATEEIKSPEEMRSLLNRAVARKRDELLESIGRVLSGKVIPESQDALA